MNKLFTFITVVAIMWSSVCYADRFWVGNQNNVNDGIDVILNDGGCIKDVQANRLNEFHMMYTVKYLSGADIRNEIELWRTK